MQTYYEYIVMQLTDLQVGGHQPLVLVFRFFFTNSVVHLCVQAEKSSFPEFEVAFSELNKIS